MRRPIECQTEEDRRRLLRILDELLAEGARLPGLLLNETFRFRRTVSDSLPEEPVPEEESDLPENVVPFRR
ncbi:MAG: hypothetical protein Q8P41_31690 [Pseudomonadota bacterium]|nr:hypothetical protein [Pseudomonadota bacterium]